MTKLFFIIFIFTTVFCSCSNQTTTDKGKGTTVIQKGDTTKYNGLQGTWVRQNKACFTLIEIKDTSNVLYYQFLDREIDLGKPTSDRFWYYKSKATMGYWGSSAIWISTDKFRFDYKLKDDTLIEFDKMGDQGNFIKVYTDEQKAYKSFTASGLKGEITFVNKVGPQEYFVLNNLDNEFSFTSIADNNSSNKQFTDVAAIGDSVIKAPFSDTLTLIKKQPKKSYKFCFVRLL